MSYDRQGRPAQITGATTNDFAYTAAGLLLSENAVNRSWNYASQNRIGYDALQRRNGLTNLSLGLTHTYAYDAASRLQSVGTLDSGAATLAAYSYLNNSPLVSGLTFQQNGATRLTVSEGYDNLNRLRQISSLTNAQTLVAFTYAYNLANQRAAVTNADGSSWAYGYDRLGQVTNGWRSWSDGSDVLGQTFNYAFDDIGNRKSAGTGTPAAQRTQSYSVNLLNQYTNRTVPGYLEVNGSADAAASVTVNGGAVSRQGEYYRQEVSVNNSTTALVQWLTSRATNATGTSLVARLTFVPQTPEISTCDADGNVTQDGLWNYTWDGENRLTRIETRTNAITDSNYWQRLDATYDYQSRRVRKQVSHWNPSTSSYQLSVSLRFFYDGWNLIGQVDEVTGTRLSFVWGSDLSGTMQGAGGVGGLKALIVHNGSLAGTYFYGYDGNGNVAALVNAADGTEAARYEYGPFGELLRATGPMARLNPFRFSTQYYDDEAGSIMYPRRPYGPSSGRFLTRDPIEEDGGVNLYGFVANNPINETDPLGLCNIKIRCSPVVELAFITVGWHCAVIAPSGVPYQIGGVGISGSSGGSPPIVFPLTNAPPQKIPDTYIDYPVSCGDTCCDSIQRCIQKYRDDPSNVPSYNALGPNSNTYAHNMLDHCGCKVDPIQLPCYTVLRSAKQGGPYTVCPGSTTSPPRAVGWNSGF